VQITVLTAFPGTPLYSRFLQDRRILEPGRWDLCTLFDVNYQPRDMSPQDLQEGMRWLTKHLYDDDCTRYRRDAFFAGLRRSRGMRALEGMTVP
jgi:hypothetical protein